ncbi:MAG: hypothetical protein V3U23_09480 [Kiloniellales bacterium]
MAGGAEIVLLDLLADADPARVGGLIWARRGAEAAFVAGASGAEPGGEAAREAAIAKALAALGAGGSVVV